jgi:argininosuccinate lyase
LSEELIVWMSQNFGFIQIADRFTTGSSIMPQKKNPDVPELARGKTGRVVGHLMGLITLMKAQPLAYNKDNQEDKEPLFDTVDTLKDTLRIFAEMIGGQTHPTTGAKEGGLTVNKQRMQEAASKGYATATDLADYLVKKGLPFRDAHETVAHAVKAAQASGLDLSQLPNPGRHCAVTGRNANRASPPKTCQPCPLSAPTWSSSAADSVASKPPSRWPKPTLTSH